MVVQVFSHCDEERRNTRTVPTQDAHSRTAYYTGVGRRQVVEIIRHFKETGEVAETTVSGNRSVHAPISLGWSNPTFVISFSSAI